MHYEPAKIGEMLSPADFRVKKTIKSSSYGKLFKRDMQRLHSIIIPITDREGYRQVANMHQLNAGNTHVYDVISTRLLI